MAHQRPVLIQRFFHRRIVEEPRKPDITLRSKCIGIFLLGKKRSLQAIRDTDLSSANRNVIFTPKLLNAADFAPDIAWNRR